MDPARAKGVEVKAAVEQVARATLLQHKRIIFNGNGYSKEWREEAQKRGLLNLANTVQALAPFNSPKNEKLFSSLV